jgi:hypothetical protein
MTCFSHVFSGPVAHRRRGAISRGLLSQKGFVSAPEGKKADGLFNPSADFVYFCEAPSTKANVLRGGQAQAADRAVAAPA